MLDYSNFRLAQGYPRKKITEMAFLLERGELTLTRLNVTKIRKRFCRPSGEFSGGEVGLETLSSSSSVFFFGPLVRLSSCTFLTSYLRILYVFGAIFFKVMAFIVYPFC